MKTLAASALLSIMFLSAGALAGDRNHHPVIDAVTTRDTAANVTVVFKNQVWPHPSRISVDPCQIDRCIDI